MHTAVCLVPVVAMRRHPEHQSEMVSQLLFGEGVDILEYRRDWVEVRSLADDYTGWCLRQQLLEVATGVVQTNELLMVDSWLAKLRINGVEMRVPMGAVLPAGEAGMGHWGTLQVELAEGTVTSTAAFTEARLQELALRYLHTPYLWGGRSVFGIDCSGLTQVLMRFFGLMLPRDAAQQAMQGTDVGFLQEAKCGDLAFFDNEAGDIIHVGVLLNQHEIIHAAGSVRIDAIDHAGILHRETGERTHRLRLLRRVC